MCGGMGVMKKGFTLIELLVVIAILMILMTMLMPGAAYLREQAKRRQAASEARALMNAIVSYRNEYAEWPGQVDNIDNPPDTTYGFGAVHATCSNVINILTNPVKNPRDTMFLDLPPTVLSDNYAKDPWKRSYIVVMDENTTMSVDVSATEPSTGATIITNVPGQIVVASWGPDPANVKKRIMIWEN